MTVFYKATRSDGTDFYTGLVNYAAALASGEPLPELPATVSSLAGEQIGRAHV